MDILSYSSLSFQQLFTQLKTSQEGLSTSEAKIRLNLYGLNRIENDHFLLKDFLFKNLRSYFIYLLLGAAFISFFLGNYFEGLMIFIFITINIALTFYQEYKAHKAVQLLKTYLKSQAQVVRDGKVQMIETTQLVPGDLIFIEQGTILSADIYFLTHHNLLIDESTITGESVPVAKNSSPLTKAATNNYEASNIGFAGTTVVEGKGSGIVLACGKSTMSGSLSSLTKNIIKESVFAQEINQFSTYIIVLVLATLILLFLVNIFIKGASGNIMQLLIFSIALAVGITPEALPVIITFCLSRGALHLAHNKVIVTRLAAIEDLGSIDILCSDKTGTLTENKLHVKSIYGDDPQKILLFANLAGSGVVSNQPAVINPIESALWIALDPKKQEEYFTFHKRFETGFDFKRLRNDALIQTDHSFTVVVRGVIDSVLALCAIQDKTSLLLWADQQEKQGNRVLVVAFKELGTGQNFKQEAYEEHDLKLLGMISLYDPIKKDAQQALIAAQKLGIELKILTGDSALVAGSVGYAIGLIDNPNKVITGAQLEALNEHDRKQTILNNTIFARVQPEQKFSIIKALQEKHQVGYLGDGINDLSALKAADVAIVVQGAADSARDVADIILLKKSLNNIINGIYEGRIIYANTLKYIKTELSSMFGNFYSIAIASLFINFLPLLPLQILLMNILADFPMLALATDTVDKEELNSPKNYNFKDIIILSTFLGIISSCFDFIVFALFYKMDERILQTNLFISGVLTELVLIYSLRTKKIFLQAKFPSLSLLSLSLFTAFVSIAITFTDFGKALFSFKTPSLFNLYLVIFLTAVYFCVSEAAKLGFYYFFNNKNNA